jgi:malonyl-CoA/methylmalonyl-CoA synthetase
MSRLLRRFLEHAATDKIAVHDRAGAHTFAAIEARAHGVAAELLGGRESLRGARVALLLSPSASFVAAFFGVLFAGGAVVVLSPLHPAAETRYFLEDAEVGTILVSSDLKDALAPVAGSRRVLVVDGVAPQRAGRRAMPSPAASDPALQLYTSGTTGKPKGAVITHDNLGVQQELLGEAWGWTDRDVLLHALPLHHLHGLGIAMLTALGAGAAVRMLPFEARAVWDAMAHATVFMAVPTMYTKLFAAWDEADEASRARWGASARALRLATSGSAALPSKMAERWREVTGLIPLERFGMTEIGVGLTNPYGGERRMGTCGLPLRTVETRIVGEHGEDAPSGELWIRGPSVFSSYWKREAATAEAFVADPAGGARWFRTGDTVTRDEAGYFKILGRTSVDILKSGGYKLSALEIEEVLREHPAIAEVAVVGVPDETWGERVVACVVVRAGRRLDEAEVRDFAKTKLASYKVPKNVVPMQELPRNAVGKVVKPELVRRLLGGA